MKSKKVKRIAIGAAIVAVILAVVLGVLSALGINLFSCTKNIDPGDAPESSVNVSAAPPTDGSLPTAHTGIENISYMVYVLDNQTSWHSFSDTDSIAASGINNQKTYTYKDYKDGVLIASDMTYSSFVQSSTQTAYIGDGAYSRSGSKPGKTTEITEITWNDGEPEYLERENYYLKYGLFADEISVFLLNEQTISSCGEVVDNGDGTYTQSFTLNTAAAYYYQYNMYTRGGLSSYPVFETINLTFTFDAAWQVLEVQTYEVAEVNMGVISTTNTSESHITYTYGGDCVDEYNYAFYEDYFKQYVGNVAEGGSSASSGELSVTEVLQYGFGEVLTSEGKQYAIDVTVGDTPYTGYIYASVDLNTLAVNALSAMEIRLSLGETADDQALYIELSGGEIAVYYSDSFAVSGNLSELSLMIDQISALFGGSDDDGTQTVALNSNAQNNITLLAKALLADEDEEDTDVLTQLLSIIEVVETEDGATLTIQTDDLLGTGIGIDMTMEFAKDDTNVITFTNASVKSISYGGEELTVSVTLSETEAEVITRNEEMTPVSLSGFVANVYELLSSDLLELSVTMDGASSSYAALDGLNVEASALLNINSVIVGADLYVSYTTESGFLSARIKAYYNYGASEYGDIYLYLYELDGKSVDVKLYCDISELADAITVLLGGDAEDADEAAEEVSQTAAQIINSVLALDLSQVVTQLYASGSDICLGVNLDTIMSLLGADGLPALGTAALVYDGESLSLALEALGLSIDLGKASGDIEQPDASEYVNLTGLVNSVYSLINSDTFNLTLTLDGDSENCTITQLSGLSVDLSASFDVNSLVLASAAEISYAGGESVISAKLDIYYVYSEENYGTVYVYLYELCGKTIDVKLSADISDIEELVAGLLSGTGESVSLTSDEEADLSEILEAVITFDFNSAITVLSATSSQIKLGLDVDSVLSQLGVDFSGVGALELEYADGAFVLGAENLGLAASLSGSDTAVSAPENVDEYLNVSEIVSAVTGLINSQTITAEISLSDSGISYLDGVAVDGIVSYTLESGLLKVDLTADYNGINAVLAAYYDGESVYIEISELAGASADVKVRCSVSDLSQALESLLGDTSTEISAATDGVLETILALDFGAIITELKADAAEGVILGLDIDELLAEMQVELGFELGEIIVSFNGGALALAAEQAGINVSAYGTDEAVTLPADAADYLDIIAAVQDIYSVVTSDIIDLNISIDGEKLLGSIVEGYLDGLKLDGDIKLATADYAVSADLDISYTYNERTISLGLLVYYDGAAVYLVIDEINGAAASIAVSCEIDTLSEVLESILSLAEDTESGDSGEGEQAAADIVTILLAMDYSQIIERLEASGDTIAVSVDVDGVISQLAASGVISDSLSGYSFGSVSLVYGESKLELSAEELGVNAVLSGESGTLTKPEANYLSVESVMALVESVEAEIAEIESAKSVYFDIDCYVTAEELTLGIEGYGEVDWSGETAAVALDLTLSIQDGSSNPDKINVKLLYSAEGTITMVVGGLGIQAASEDISGLQSGFTELLEAIYTLAGVSGSGQENAETVSALADVDASGELNSLLLKGDLPEILTVLLEIVSSTDWVEELSNFTLTVDGVSAVIEHAEGYSLAFTADGGLALVSTSACGNENYIKVSSGTGLYAEVESALSSEDYTIMTVDENTKLTEIIYNFGLGVISNASIANTLGTDTYTVSLALEGDNTGVKALEGVTVYASLYYTDSVDETGKLTEMDVDMNIGGVTAVFNIIYYDESLYITLTNINNTDLNGLKVTVALGDVYAIADQLVEVLLNTNLVDYFASSEAEAVSEDGGDVEVTQSEASAISEILVKILSLDFSELIGCAKTVEEDGTVTRSVWVDIDGIYKAFAETDEGIGLGAVTASVITYSDENGKTRRAIEVYGVYGENDAWLDISAKRAETRDYSAFDTSEYWDLAFLKHLISDAVNFATDDNGEIYTIYTFSGDLTASVIGIDINIDVLNLTVGLDEDNHIYVTLLGDLDYSSVLLLGTITEDWLFGFNIAYSSEYGGYLVTCANNLGTTDAQYQVMTLNYLTDNLLKSNSCLQFMLGTSSTLWSTICSGLSAGGIALDSGIATPDEMYLTNGGSTLDTTESSVTTEFDISSIITGITALIDGESYACGTTNVSYGKLASQIGSSDYYAIDLNNDTIDDLTGGGITEVYAAILRNSDGISGLAANGYIGGVMSFTLNLTYNEGINEEYDLLSGEGTLVYEQVEAAESEFYAEAAEESADGYYIIDENGNYVYTDTVDSESTPYVFSNNTYYIKNDDGTYTLATSYDSAATYYAANYSSDITGFYAPNLYSVVITNYGQELDYDRYSETEGSTNTFGCFTMTYDGTEWTGEYTDQTELYYFTLTVIYPDDSGIAAQSYQLKYSSTIYANASDNTFANGDLYVYYIVTYAEDGSEILTPMGSSYTFTGDITVKAVLVVYQVTVNGVVYTFDADSNGYVVTGVSGDGYSGAILELESEINGYEVTAIGDEAFLDKCKSGGALESVTTIVVPESITSVGGRAFHGCTGLQTVVFLADTIYMECTVYGNGCGEPQGYAFWGCSSSLTVYYTNVTADDHSYLSWSYTGTTWCWSYSATYNALSIKYTPNVVNTVSSGWTYTGGAVSDCEIEALESVINGVLLNYSGVNVNYDINDITTAVQNAVDKYMLENYGYVGYYRVELSASEELDGRYNVITATVKSGCGEYYLLDITQGYGTVEISSEDDNIYYYNGAAYVQAGTTVTITVSDVQTGYNFSEFTATYGCVEYSGGEYYYDMPAEAVNITAKYEVAEADITVYSEISFTYDYNGTDLSYVAGTDSSITAVEGAALTASVTAAESGYYFLGWAQVQEDGSLAFAGSDVTAVNGLELYAVWGYSSQSLTGYTVATSGAALVTDLTCDSGTFYKWYSDGAFTTEITEISTADTVVYARWLFSLDFNFSESNSKLIVDGSTYASDTSTLTCTYSVDVLEGYYVTVAYSKGSYKYVLSTKYYTIVTVTVYDGEGGSSVETHTMYLNKADNNNGDRYLSISDISANWSGTTSGSSLTSGSAYATINGYTYISY